MVMMRTPRQRCGAKSKGFTYLWMLAAIAVMSIGLLAVSEVWTTTARRQKLDELEWVGQQFKNAIGSYYESSIGLGKSYPRSLQELLEDRRFAVPRRHLRAIYRNPFALTNDWEVVRSTDGKVRGVRAVLPAELGSQVREFVYVPTP